MISLSNFAVISADVITYYDVVQAPENLPPVLGGTVQMFLAQLPGRKENRSLLRLWLSQGAYLLTVSQSSWACIASTSWGLGTVDSSVFLGVRVHAHVDVCARLHASSQYCKVNVCVLRCESKRDGFIHSLPSLIFDILWPCMAD